MARFYHSFFKILIWGAVALGAACGMNWDARAAGKKSPTDGGSCSIGGYGSNPVRPVVVLPVSTIPFPLPNGQTVSLAYDLKAMVSTALTANSNFREVNAIAPTGPCESHLEIAAGISTLDLDVVDANVKFGYTPSGATSTISNLNAEASVKVGTLSMDFSVRLCQQGRCLVLAAASSNQSLVDLGLSFKVNFGQISTGTDLVTKTALGNALRSVMVSGIQRLNAAAQRTELPWQAAVAGVTNSAGTLTFTAGRDQNIQVGDSFEVFAGAGGNYTCSVYQIVGLAHAVRVNAVSTDAALDQVFDRGVAIGDAVMVGKKAAAVSAIK